MKANNLRNTVRLHGGRQQAAQPALPMRRVTPLRSAIVRAFCLVAVLGSAAAEAATLPLNPTMPVGTIGTSAGCAQSVCVFNPSTSTLTVQQNVHGALIDWGSFNISAGGLVQFLQGFQNAISVNRVIGGGSSTIDGSLKSTFNGATNGNIVLINSNGIIIGAGGSINAGSILLSTRDLTDPNGTATALQNFTTGSSLDFTFSSGSPNAVSVASGGSVTGANGAYLLGDSVSVAGTVSGGSGPVLIGAADGAQLDYGVTTGANSTLNLTGASTARTSANPSVAISGNVSGTRVQIDALAQDTAAMGTLINLNGVVTSSSGGITVVSSNTAGDGGLAVGGTLSAAGQAISLQTVGTGNALTIGGAVNAGGTGMVTLNSADAISEGAGGVITAGSLSGQSVTGSTVTGSNQVADLGSLSNSGSGGIAFSDSQALNVAGSITANGQAISLQTQGSGNALAINGVVNAGSAGTVALKSDAAVSQGAGSVVTAGTLSGSSATGTSLTGNNQVASLGTLSNSGSGGISFNDNQGLSITGPVTASGQAISLQTQGTGNALAINGAVNAGSAGTVALKSGDAISEGAGGSVTAATLTGNSVTGATLNGSNQVANLGAFRNGTSGGISFNDGQALTVSGTVQATGGGTGQNIALTTSNGGLTVSGGSVNASGNAALTTSKSGAGNDIVIGNAGGAGTITGGNIILVSSDAIAEAAGNGVVVTTGTLSGSAVTGTSLSGANQVANLGSFSNSGGGGISFSDNKGLSVTGPVMASGQAISLQTQGAGNALAINGAVNAGSTGTVALNSADAISEGAGGVITASSLSGQSAAGTILTGSNQVASLGSFSNSISGGISFNDNQGLSVAGPLTASGQAISLQTQGTGNALAINGTVNAGSSGSVALKSANAISEGAGGGVTAGTLSGSSVTGTSLTGNNQVASLGSFSNTTSGGISLVDNQALTVDGSVLATGNGSGQSIALTTNSGNLTVSGGSVNATGNVAFTTKKTGGGNDIVIGNTGGAGTVTGGNVILVSADAIAEAAGNGAVVTTGTLSGSSVTGTSLTGSNQVANLGAFGNTTSGGISFNDARALNVSGQVAAANQAVSLTTTGTGNALTVNNTVGGGMVSLSSGGGQLSLNDTVTGTTSVTLFGAQGINGSGNVNTPLLTGSAAGDIVVTGNIGAIGSLVTSNGSITSTGLSSLQVTGNVSASKAVDLNANGGLSVTGNVAGNTVALSTTGGALNIGGGVTSQTTVNLASNDGLSIGGNVSGTAVTLATTGGDLAVTGGVSGSSSVNATSSGALTIGGSVNGGSANNEAVTLAAAGGNLSVGGSVSGAAVTLNTTGAGDGVAVTGGVIGSGAVGITSKAGATVNGSVTGNGVAITTTGGDIYVGGAVNGGTGAVALNSSGNISITPATGSSATNAVTGGDVTFSSQGTTVVAGAVNGSSVAFNSQGSISVGGAVNGGSVNLQSKGSSIDVSGAVSATGADSLTADTGLQVGGNVSGNTVALTTTGGNIGIGGTVTGVSGIDAKSSGTLTVGGNVDGGNTGAVTLSSGGGSLAVTGNVTGNTVALASNGGDLTVGGVVTGASDVSLASTGNIGISGSATQQYAVMSKGTAEFSAGNPQVPAVGNIAFGANVLVNGKATFTLNAPGTGIYGTSSAFKVSAGSIQIYVPQNAFLGQAPTAAQISTILAPLFGNNLARAVNGDPVFNLAALTGTSFQVNSTFEIDPVGASGSISSGFLSVSNAAGVALDTQHLLISSAVSFDPASGDSGSLSSLTSNDLALQAGSRQQQGKTTYNTVVSPSRITAGNDVVYVTPPDEDHPAMCQPSDSGDQQSPCMLR